MSGGFSRVRIWQMNSLNAKDSEEIRVCLGCVMQSCIEIANSRIASCTYVLGEPFLIFTLLFSSSFTHSSTTSTWHFTEQCKHPNNSILTGHRHGGLGIDWHLHVCVDIKLLALRELIPSDQSGGLIP